MAKMNWRVGLLAVAGIALAGCSSDEEAAAPVSETPTSAQVPGGNMAPAIAGSPLTTVAAGSFYSFTPVATDADGDMLSYTISGKPGWAAFSVATGALTGGTQAGTYANIIISVSDGKTTRTLPAFTLTVTSAPAPSAGAGTGTAALSWTEPKQYTDGGALPMSDLAGYNVYHGSSADALNESFTVSGAATTRYTFTGLAPGVHYFAVSAMTVSGQESGLSVTGSKTIL